MVVKVGEIAYDISLDTRKLIEGQRDVEKSTDKMEVALTAVAEATQVLVAATKLLADALNKSARAERDGAAAAGDLADATKSATTAAKQGAKASDEGAASTKKQTAAVEDLADAQKRAAEAAKKRAQAEKEASSAPSTSVSPPRQPPAPAQAPANGGMSPAALAAATRNIPAQVTDIVTGLSTGQSPFTVLMQQGGQLKDMFGGIGNAARALGGYIAGLLSPFTVAAGAVAALAIGFLKGRAETEEFRKALVLTGDQSGVTVDQLNSLAARMDSLDGVTRGKAAAALTEFVAAGIRGADALGKFTEAAIRLEEAGGPAVSDTAKAFRELAKDPLNASLKLNDSVNFLTTSLYQQIKALEDQGKHVEAAKVAQNAYADAIMSRTPSITQNLGLLERAWKGVANAAKEGWDALLSVGRQATPEEALASTRKQIEQIEKTLASGGFSSTGGGAATGRGLQPKQREALEGQLAALKEQVQLYQKSQTLQQGQAEAQAKSLAQVKARSEFDKEGVKFLSERLKMEQEIAQARSLGQAAGLDEKSIKAREDAIRASYDKKSSNTAAQPKFDGAGYLAGLAEKTASELDRVAIIEEEALRKNDELLAKRNISVEQAEQARNLIMQNAAQQRADLLVEEINKENEERTRAEAERQKGRDMATNIITGGDEITRLQADLQTKSQLLLEAYGRDQANEELYAQARLALEQQTAAKIKEIRDRQANDQLQQQSAQLMAYSNLFGNMASLTQTFAGKQSGVYKAMFVASKAFAIADSVIKIQQGIASAAAMPFPANLAAMGSVVAATSSIISTISGVQYGGGRQYGGGVNAGDLYRVNETGRPEMYTASNGKQYMLPTKDGNVTPADQVGGGSGVTIIVQNAPAGYSPSVSADQKTVIIDMAVAQAKAEIAAEFSSNSGATWSALRGASNVQGRL